MMKLTRKHSSKRIPSLKRFRTAKMKRDIVRHVRSLSDSNANVQEENSAKTKWSRNCKSARDLDTNSRRKTSEQRLKINQTSGCSERVEEDEDDDCFEFVWRYGEHTFEVPYQMNGEGVRKILFLPTIHIASSYKELIPLTRFFGDFYTTFVPDWPGFGNSSRLNCTYCPLMYLQFIRDFIKEVMNEESVSVIACGHSCGYVLSLAKSYPQMWNRICIVSPTYKAPVKALGWHSISSSLFKSAIKTSVLSDYLYQKATQPSFLRKQYETQIFKDKSLVTDEFIKKKHKLVNKAQGKFGPVSFFTGKLDIVKNREEMDSLITSVKCPVILVIGDNSPSSSLTEMKEFSNSPRTEVIRLEGSLGVAEESPRDVAEILSPFFPKTTSTA